MFYAVTVDKYDDLGSSQSVCLVQAQDKATAAYTAVNFAFDGWMHKYEHLHKVNIFAIFEHAPKYCAYPILAPSDGVAGYGWSACPSFSEMKL
jgi:hypothetical protein